MKKYIAAAVCCILLVMLLPATAFAEFDPESVSTPYIVLMDANTGAVLYQKNSNEQAFPASTTKIMTAILAIESGKLDDVVDVGSDVETKGSCINIVRNEQMPLRDLVYGMMLRSGNDAAKAIAVYLAGSESEFANMMNNKAAELGMSGTHFVKPNGLHEENHYSTAYDMALLTKYCMQNEEFKKIVSSGTYHAAATNKDSDGYDWENSNKLLHTKEGEDSYEYRYAIGVKTGDTAQAGRCLAAAAQKDGVTLILILFGDYENKVSTNYRFENSAKFFDWGFANYSSVDASQLGLESTVELPVSNASFEDEGNGNLVINIELSGVTVSGMKSDIDAITADPTLISSNAEWERTLSAPVEAGELLGVMYYRYNGNALFKANMTASRSVAEIGAVASANPSSSPLLVNPEKDGESSGRSWVFWLLLLIVVVIIAIIIRLLLTRRTRRRNRNVRRRKSSRYRVYRR